LKGVPVFTWNLLQIDTVKWQGKEALKPGKHTLEFDWKYDGPGLGKGGTGTLKVDGQVVDTKEMPKSLPVGIGWVETFNVGVDTGTSVDGKDYQVPFPFTGQIAKLTVKLGPEELTPAEQEMIYGTMRNRQ
jgi:arylsulfatase